MPTLQQIDRKFKTLVTKNEKLSKEYQSKLDKLKAENAEIKKDFAKAEEKDDIDTALSLTKEANANEVTIKYLEEKLEELKEAPLVATDKELEAFEDQIKEEAECRLDELFKQLKAPLLEIKKLAEQSQEITNHADTLIHALVYDIGRLGAWGGNAYLKAKGESWRKPSENYYPRKSVAWVFDSIEERYSDELKELGLEAAE
ncbi:hypothetical protein [Aerococcus tenax]|uniref:hypothetical protein n=1 Tax=Aerococcus tenax TaxID=3078812 RepID=UPI0018A7BCBD|nr:hypothetical protein [Aerococcus tenax]